MDRNSVPFRPASHLSKVALRKESVDRNLFFVALKALGRPSLSARRAWIEMLLCNLLHHGRVVALRKESVDRNQNGRNGQNIKRVALRKESVDRNREQFKYVVQCRSRSPQGERG